MTGSREPWDPSCQLNEEGLTFVPRLEVEEPPLAREGLDMSEALSCPNKDTPAPGCRLGTLYWACAHNDPAQLQAKLDVGVSPEEASRVDSNGRTGLMVACYHGFGNIVDLLSRCPFLDVNQQDKEGDTALMLAAQAGHVPLVSLLLNYYSGLDLERRDQRGLTALMKAAMRNRAECVAALLMAGADLSSADPVRGKTALEWAVMTDSFDTVRRIQQLLRRPQAQQLSQCYHPEWPALAQLVSQTRAQTTPSFLERLQATLNLSFVQSPQEGGVLDHFVTVTTGLASPFLTTACHTLCPNQPPALGTRGKSVPELLGTTPPPPLVPQPPQVFPWSPGICSMPEPSRHAVSAATVQAQYQYQISSPQDPPIQGTFFPYPVHLDTPAYNISKSDPSSLEIPGAQDGEEEAGRRGTEPRENGLASGLKQNTLLCRSSSAVPTTPA